MNPSGQAHMSVPTSNARPTHQPARPPNKQARKRALRRVVIGFFLAFYSLVTIVPFYFLAVRSFVPTQASTELHLWIPKAENISLNGRLGNMCTFYNVDLTDFKKAMGIVGYINPSLTLGEVGQKFNIPEEKLTGYFQNYLTYNGMYAIFGSGQFLKHLVITICVVAVSIGLGGLLGLATGSVLAGFRRRWHLWVYYLYLLQIAISPMMIILPLYLIITQYLKLYDSYLALILLYIKGGALSTMVFTSYIGTIPQDLRESVELDGGNHPQYFYYVLLPLCKTPFAIYTAISLPLFWNDLLNGFLFLSPEKYTLMPLINAFSGTFATNLQAVYSGLLLATIPLLVVYLIFRRMFVKSALSGAIKG
jgi:ABC-type glycerol-3-phosphate transport system permease component